MPSYYVGNIPVGGNDIFHYGVKGMRWGVVNEEKPSVFKRFGNIIRYNTKAGATQRLVAAKARYEASSQKYHRAKDNEKRFEKLYSTADRNATRAVIRKVNAESAYNSGVDYARRSAQQGHAVYNIGGKTISELASELSAAKKDRDSTKNVLDRARRYIAENKKNTDELGFQLVMSKQAYQLAESNYERVMARDQAIQNAKGEVKSAAKRAVRKIQRGSSFVAKLLGIGKSKPSAVSLQKTKNVRGQNVESANRRTIGPHGGSLGNGRGRGGHR